MKRLIIALCAVFLFSSIAEARHYKRHYRHWSGSYVQHHFRDYRPARWCGWYMRKRHGGGPALNLARNWASVGSRASGPARGVIVVWWHHVGEIVGQNSRGQWLVHSGNDGGAVRTRARSLRGVIAYRWPGGRSYHKADVGQWKYAMR